MKERSPERARKSGNGRALEGHGWPQPTAAGLREEGVLCRRKRRRGGLPVPVLRAFVIGARPGGEPGQNERRRYRGIPPEHRQPQPLGVGDDINHKMWWTARRGRVVARGFRPQIRPLGLFKEPPSDPQSCPQPRPGRRLRRARGASANMASRSADRRPGTGGVERAIGRRAVSRSKPRRSPGWGRRSGPRVIPRYGGRRCRVTCPWEGRGDLLSYRTCDMAETERAAQPALGAGVPRNRLRRRAVRLVTTKGDASATEARAGAAAWARGPGGAEVLP
jgi:hypothetical protein